MLKKNNKGFTLVELLVVIAIIGILAVVAVPALFKNINKAKVADVESDYSSIKSAVLSYYTDNNEFPIGDLSTINTLDNYMDSVPTKSAIDGTYSIVKGAITEKHATNSVLALQITTPKVTTAQTDKLLEDIGIEKVYIGTTLAGANELTKGTALSNGQNIYLILVDNTSM